MLAASSNTARDGELVIVCEGPNAYQQLTLRRGDKFSNRCGAFRHDDFIGSTFGSKVVSSTGGYVMLLRPTPELWTQALNHRTQILFSTDIAMVVLQLGLRPGSVVLETGTGSGSLSVSLARAVAPHGHVYTFEFNEDRAKKAVTDFAALGLKNLITVEHRDSCGQGFGAPFENMAHGVFLDLPQPWLAIPHAKRALRVCGVLCSFSPCIEQVQRACATMQEEGFEDIRTLETLLRPYDVFHAPAQATKLDMHGDFSSSAVLASHATSVRAGGCGGSGSAKRQRVGVKLSSDVNDSLGEHDDDCDNGARSSPVGEVEAATEDLEAPSSAGAPTTAAAADDSCGISRLQSVPFPDSLRSVPAAFGHSRPASTARGHTGFLTFATLYRRAPEKAATAASSSNSSSDS